MHAYMIFYNFRVQISGALSGNSLGEASHRLIRNSLQIKPTSSTAGLLDMPYRGGPRGPTNTRPRPAGPYGYAEENTHNNYTPYQGYANYNPNPQLNQHNARIQERPGYNIQAGMSRLTVNQQYTRAPNPSVAGYRASGSESVSFQQAVPPEHPGVPPPFPPNNWIGRQERSRYNGGGPSRGGFNEKRPGPQVVKVYRVKSQNSVANEQHDPVAKSL